MPMSRPRRSRIWLFDSVNRSTSSNCADPPTSTPRLGSRPMIASDVTDLPQPDSPTRPTVWPGSTLKLTPSTARTGFSPRRPNVTVRSLTSRRAMELPPVLGIESLAERLTEQSEAERYHDDAERRPDRQRRLDVEVGLRVAQHRAPLGAVGVGVAETQERQRG